MYHLLVSYAGWKSTDSLTADRVFECTEDRLVQIFSPSGVLDRAKIFRVPALFVSEIGGSGTQLARIGYINRINATSSKINIGFSIEQEIPPIPNARLKKLSSELGVENFEFSRTHWAIKDVDLYRVLLKNHPFSRVSPKVFKIEETTNVQDDLISAMMPFAAEFDQVYKSLQEVADELWLECLRADDIWEHDAIIQDVVSLIHRSRIVICDCSGRNPNVFYETGIAHTLGKDVILITQQENDIPFDLRHLRFIKYLNNNEGREELSKRLRSRINRLMKSARE